MKTKTLLLLGLCSLSLSALAATEVAETDKLGKTPGEKAIQKVLDGKDKAKTPSNMEFNGSALEAQYAKQPGFASESTDHKENEKFIEASQAKILDQSSGHVQALYKCGKIGDIKASRDCRNAEAKKKSKK